VRSACAALTEVASTRANSDVQHPRDAMPIESGRPGPDGRLLVSCHLKKRGLEPPRLSDLDAALEASGPLFAQSALVSRGFADAPEPSRRRARDGRAAAPPGIRRKLPRRPDDLVQDVAEDVLRWAPGLCSIAEDGAQQVACRIPSNGQ
jgi:hypothetical protein